MRYSKSYIQRRFERIAKLMNWYTGEAWKPEERGGRLRAVIGHVSLDYAPIYGGYQIAQLCNEGGGERQLLPRRMKAAELDAWLDGVEYALERR